MSTTARQIIHDAFEANDVGGLDYYVDHDQVTAILTKGDAYFALGDDGDTYSWVTGHVFEDSCSGTRVREPGPSDGAQTEAEARAAVAAWISQVPSEH